jgi:hypothetical protein
MEKAGYIILMVVAACWLIAMIAGMIVSFPVGIIGLLAIVGFGLLFIRVLKDRIEASKTDKYSRDVEK